MSDAVPGAVIHYTKDGSIPTTSSPVYTGSFADSPKRTTTQVYQALATASGYYTSSPSVATFTITLPAGTLAQATVGTTRSLPFRPTSWGSRCIGTSHQDILGRHRQARTSPTVHW